MVVSMCSRAVADPEYQYLYNAPVVYTHREYVGVGPTRGKTVPGVAKVQMRLKVADLALSDGQKHYLEALAGLRIRDGHLILVSDTYPEPQGTPLLPCLSGVAVVPLSCFALRRKAGGALTAR